jgi:hypothetical protein
MDWAGFTRIAAELDLAFVMDRADYEVKSDYSAIYVERRESCL